jgi:RNA polymerase sigma-70 factor (ECF subfamily)
VQEAFLRLLRGGPATPQEGEQRRYLFRIASNLIIDRWRAGSRSAEGPASPPPPVAVDEERDHDVARTFATLHARDRALLWLAYVEGESHAEIAASLGVGTRSVKVLLFRAKRRLKDLLNARGLSRT